MDLFRFRDKHTVGHHRSQVQPRNVAWLVFTGWVISYMISLVAQTVKHLPTMRETQVQSLGREDPLEKAMATHSSTLAWKIPWMEKPGRLHSMAVERVGHD